MFGRSRRLGEARRRFAEELRQKCELRSELLTSAFAEVERERFVPPGPWLLLETADGYASTLDADPIQLYRDVAVGIDPSRLLNNSQPSLFARIFDALGVQQGERVVHLGCATGYYTAILARLVGRSGKLVAVEIDPRQAAQARRNLRSLRQVEVVHADAMDFDPGPTDVLLVDGGVTHPRRQWLERLRAGGRLAMPLTAVRAPSRLSRFLRHDLGRVLLVRRDANGFRARFADGLAIASLYGGKDPQRQQHLEQAYQSGGFERVRSLRTDAHAVAASCWLHEPDWCLSSAEPGAG